MRVLDQKGDGVFLLEVNLGGREGLVLRRRSSRSFSSATGPTVSFCAVPGSPCAVGAPVPRTLNWNTAVLDPDVPRRVRQWTSFKNRRRMARLMPWPAGLTTPNRRTRT